MQGRLDRRALKSLTDKPSNSVKQEFHPYGVQRTFISAPHTPRDRFHSRRRSNWGCGRRESFLSGRRKISDEDEDQEDTEDRIQDELASSLATENLDQEEEDKESEQSGHGGEHKWTLPSRS